MGTKTTVVTWCDVCKKEGQVWNVHRKIGRQADAAGGMEDVFGAVDLCLSCYVYWAQTLAIHVQQFVGEDLITAFFKKKFAGLYREE